MSEKCLVILFFKYENDSTPSRQGRMIVHHRQGEWFYTIVRADWFYPIKGQNDSTPSSELNDSTPSSQGIQRMRSANQIHSKYLQE